MIVLITGAAGFIGSHLVDRYLADAWDVIGVDNFLTGSPENNVDAKKSAKFSFYEHDVTTPWATLLLAIEKAGKKPNLVLHFASPASPIDYANLPVETLRVNSLGTEYAALAALGWGARFLYASTSETYGDPLEHPQRESYWGNVNPVGFRSCYDEAKRYGEALVSTYVRTKKLDGRIIRIFNTYGPRMRGNDGRVVPNFLMQAAAGKPLTIYGGGKQTRSFCYVSDLVDGIVRCAASDKTIDGVTNLGNPSEFTISELAEIVCRLFTVPLHTIDQPMPPDDPGRRCPDITRAKSLLEWTPKIELEEGLRKTIASLVPAEASVPVV